MWNTTVWKLLKDPKRSRMQEDEYMFSGITSISKKSDARHANAAVSVTWLYLPW